MIFDCDERMRRGVKIAAAESGKSASDIISEALESYIPDQLTRAQKTIEQVEDGPKSQRGRKPKAE